jgi:hypothetical protein
LLQKVMESCSKTSFLLQKWLCVAPKHFSYFGINIYIYIYIHTNIYIYIYCMRGPFVPLPAKSYNSALEEQLALIAIERVNICPSLIPIGRCQVLVYMCVNVYAYSHIMA